VAGRTVTIRTIVLGGSPYLCEDDILSILEDRLEAAMTMESRLMLTHHRCYHIELSENLICFQPLYELEIFPVTFNQLGP